MRPYKPGPFARLLEDMSSPVRRPWEWAGHLLYWVLLLPTILFALVVACRPGPVKNQEPDSGVSELRYKEWYIHPLVIVCPTSPYNYHEVQNVLDWWALEVGVPQLTAVPGDCFGPNAEIGTVRVDIPSAELWSSVGAGAVGVTSVMHVLPGDRSSPQILAEVGVPVRDHRTLVHEIGHLWFSGHVHGAPATMSYFIEDFSDFPMYEVQALTDYKREQKAQRRRK